MPIAPAWWKERQPRKRFTREGYADFGIRALSTDTVQGSGVLGFPNIMSMSKTTQNDYAGGGPTTYYATGPGAMSEAYYASSNILAFHDFNYKTYFQILFALSSYANIRLFCGFTQVALNVTSTPAIVIGADNPSFLGAEIPVTALQFSAPRGDTTLQWLNQDGGGSPTLIDTGAAVVSSQYLKVSLELIGGASPFVHLIVMDFATDVVLVNLTNSLTIPAAGVPLLFVCGIQKIAMGASVNLMLAQAFCAQYKV
jgi:hypothetical protein